MRALESNIQRYIKRYCEKYTLPQMVEILNSRYGKHYTYRSLLKHYYRHNLKFKPVDKYETRIGHKCPHAKKIGTESNKDAQGRIRVKVNKTKWVYKHRLILMQNNQEVKEDDFVVFLDNDKTNFNVDNLMVGNKKAILRITKELPLSNNKELNKLNILTSELDEKTRKWYNEYRRTDLNERKRY